MPDILRLDATTAGGISEAVKVCALAAAESIPVLPHIFPELHVHLAAALPIVMAVEVTDPAQEIDLFWQVLEEPLRPVDGHVTAPTGPGIGMRAGPRRAGPVHDRRRRRRPPADRLVYSCTTQLLVAEVPPMSIPVARLNHAVLYVRDATRAAEFYGRVFGFEVVESAFGGRAVFLRSASGENHHDLGLFSVGEAAPRPAARLGRAVPPGLGGPDDRGPCRGRRDVLSEAGALGGASDHGVSKSLYGADPDGNEFEIMWRVPREAWGEYADKGAVMPLDLDAEVRRWGAGRPV